MAREKPVAPSATPGIKLAPGGGGPRGVGERLQSEGCTGACVFTIPVMTTAARSFTPELELTYSSSAGQGTFGQGFDLSLSTISRRTSLGIPRYDDSDVFLLDGE